MVVTTPSGWHCSSYASRAGATQSNTLLNNNNGLIFYGVRVRLHPLPNPPPNSPPT